MSDKQLDRRVRRTRCALQDSLISLILEKGYDAVTIEDITDRADLGRTTFYLHYKDKEELLMRAIDAIAEDFMIEHAPILDAAGPTESALKKLRMNLDERVLYHIFAHARENADLYKAMLRGEGSAKASQRISDLIRDETIKRLTKLPGLDSKVPLEVLALFFSGTLIEMVSWWLENDEPYSIEDMVSYFQQMFVFGAMNTLNMNKDASV
ncbi:MAG: TetR/AcrR family transcriptional regulator [Chloroflexota bacterium]|nr:TetR/AcrR family transcriptional regulator [Chloroflexota bacterium]